MPRRTGSLARFVPHAFTFARLPLGLAFLFSFDAGRFALAASVLALAVLTDYLDGMLARRLGTVGAFGKVADPVCDALFFLAVFVSFTRAALMPPLLLGLFVAREALQNGLVRPVAARLGIDPGARTAGKVKTALQCAGSAAVVALAWAASAGLLAAADAASVSLAVLALLVAVSVGSLYWYVVPLLRLGEDGRLVASIASAVVAHSGANAAALSALAAAEGGARMPSLPVAALAGWQILVAALLLARRRDLAAREGPPRLNLPCQLTLVRLCSAPFFAYAVGAERSAGTAAAVLALLALAFLTDLLDGKLARARGEETFMGRYLDPVSDYVLLGSCLIAATATGTVPSWYFAVFAARFALFPAGMALIGIVRGRIEPESSFLGKVAIFATMVTFALQLCRRFGLPAVGAPAVVAVVEFLAAGILVVSLAEKLVYVARTLGAR